MYNNSQTLSITVELFFLEQNGYESNVNVKHWSFELFMPFFAGLLILAAQVCSYHSALNSLSAYKNNILCRRLMQ